MKPSNAITVHIDPVHQAKATPSEMCGHHRGQTPGRSGHEVIVEVFSTKVGVTGGGLDSPLIVRRDTLEVPPPEVKNENIPFTGSLLIKTVRERGLAWPP